MFPGCLPLHSIPVKHIGHSPSPYSRAWHLVGETLGTERGCWVDAVKGCQSSKTPVQHQLAIKQHWKATTGSHSSHTKSISSGGVLIQLLGLAATVFQKDIFVFSKAAVPKLHCIRWQEQGCRLSKHLQ